MKEHYAICEESDTGALQRRVCKLMAKGWVPTGGITTAFHKNSGRNIFYQAMVAQDGEPFEPK